MCAAHCPIVSARDGEGGHGRNRSPLSQRSGACLCVCLTEIYTTKKRKEPLDCSCSLSFLKIMTLKKCVIGGGSRQHGWHSSAAYEFAFDMRQPVLLIHHQGRKKRKIVN